MGNILFEHNLKAYEAAILLMQETGRAAVIHPTGTGKSFIAFKLCADNKNKKICWLSPSEYIYRTQEEKWLSAGGDKCQNIRFFTYAKLIRMGEEEFSGQSFDYIILDEFHRLGAAQWGAGVERLWAKYPDARVLGLSATNIRYLDNQRDMAWELFGGNIASELTLGEAVARGILPAPKYVLSIYSYRKELEKYQTRIRHSKNRAVRDAAQKELEALRRALDKADGLSEVFARHMPPVDMVGQNRRNNAVDGQKQDVVAEEFDYNPENRGRYIVFCANYNHLNEMKALAGEWFAKVDPTPHIYTAYSDDPGSAREFEEFKKDESAHLKLLYCIDMLNEGIHVDGLDGVILLRPTVSPIIYKQQIGRALAAGGRKAPLIFDIVMNIENLCSIGAVEEELGETVLCHRASGCKDEIVQTHFNVVDEVGDCRKLFRQLNETLGASWEAMYALAKDYYLEHGNLLAPAHYSTASGYSLGAWLATQRKVYLGKVSGNLSVGQVKRLESIGMVWEGKGRAAWRGRKVMPRRVDITLGTATWRSRQLTKRRTGSASGVGSAGRGKYTGKFCSGGILPISLTVEIWRGMETAGSKQAFGNRGRQGISPMGHWTQGSGGMQKGLKDLKKLGWYGKTGIPGNTDSISQRSITKSTGTWICQRTILWRGSGSGVG